MTAIGRRWWIVLTGAIIAALALWNGVVSVTRSVNPSIALTLSPSDARAATRLADRLLARQRSPAELKEAGELATRALERDATVAPAYRILGFAQEASMGTDRARSLIVKAETLSRRDFPSQLWLIEEAVRRNDVAEALRHFDIALRASSDAPRILFPILTNAVDDPVLAPQIARTLAGRPAWRDRFLAFAIDSTRSAAPYARLAWELTSRRSPLNDDQRLQLARKLVDQEQFPLAARLVSVRRKTQSLASDLSRHSADVGDFPFAWAEVGGEALLIEPDPKRMSSNVVWDAPPDWSGEAVRRLLVLRPGRYSVAFASRQDIMLTITCGNSPRVQLLTMTGESSTARRDFLVPATACNGQWMTLHQLPSDPSGAKGPQVRQIRIVPL